MRARPCHQWRSGEWYLVPGIVTLYRFPPCLGDYGGRYTPVMQWQIQQGPATFACDFNDRSMGETLKFSLRFMWKYEILSQVMQHRWIRHSPFETLSPVATGNSEEVECGSMAASQLGSWCPNAMDVFLVVAWSPSLPWWPCIINQQACIINAANAWKKGKERVGVEGVCRPERIAWMWQPH